MSGFISDFDWFKTNDYGTDRSSEVIINTDYPRSLLGCASVFPSWIQTWPLVGIHKTKHHVNCRQDLFVRHFNVAYLESAWGGVVWGGVVDGLDYDNAYIARIGPVWDVEEEETHLGFAFEKSNDPVTIYAADLGVQAVGYCQLSMQVLQDGNSQEVYIIVKKDGVILDTYAYSDTQDEYLSPGNGVVMAAANSGLTPYIDDYKIYIA